MTEQVEVLDSIVQFVRRKATTGVHNGLQTASVKHYIDECTQFHPFTGTIVIYTRDVGHHTSGWMKNPDYERCLHLSLSFREPQPSWSVGRIAKPRTLAQLGAVIARAPYNHRLAALWVEKVLYPHSRLAWVESAKSPEGIELGVTHYRVFCDESWMPIMPRGEVYDTTFTELGWRSYSDLNEPRPSHVNAD